MTSAEYSALSRRYLHDGDLRMAQLAAWAGDVHVLEDLLWQNGLDRAPDAVAELAAVGESVAASLEDLAANLTAANLTAANLTARSVVEAARGAMLAAFDESVHSLLTDRFDDLGQLDEHVDATTSPTSPASPASPEVHRGAGYSAHELAAELRTAAGDCATMAVLLDAAGEPEAAERLDRQAEVAAFEGYLVSAAMLAGDHALATVELRWDLVADDEATPAPRSRRQRFLDVVGSAERDDLLAAFESVDVS